MDLRKRKNAMDTENIENDEELIPKSQKIIPIFSSQKKVVKNDNIHKNKKNQKRSPNEHQGNHPKKIKKDDKAVPDIHTEITSTDVVLEDRDNNSSCNTSEQINTDSSCSAAKTFIESQSTNIDNTKQQQITESKNVEDFKSKSQFKVDTCISDKLNCNDEKQLKFAENSNATAANDDYMREIETKSKLPNSGQLLSYVEDVSMKVNEVDSLQCSDTGVIFSPKLDVPKRNIDDSDNVYYNLPEISPKDDCTIPVDGEKNSNINIDDRCSTEETEECNKLPFKNKENKPDFSNNNNNNEVIIPSMKDNPQSNADGNESFAVNAPEESNIKSSEQLFDIKTTRKTPEIHAEEQLLPSHAEKQNMKPQTGEYHSGLLTKMENSESNELSIVSQVRANISDLHIKTQIPHSQTGKHLLNPQAEKQLSDPQITKQQQSDSFTVKSMSNLLQTVNQQSDIKSEKYLPAPETVKHTPDSKITELLEPQTMKELSDIEKTRHQTKPQIVDKLLLDPQIEKHLLKPLTDESLPYSSATNSISNKHLEKQLTNSQEKTCPQQDSQVVKHILDVDTLADTLKILPVQQAKKSLLNEPIDNHMLNQLDVKHLPIPLVSKPVACIQTNKYKPDLETTELLSDTQTAKYLSNSQSKKQLPDTQVIKQLLPNLQSDTQTAKYLPGSFSKKQLPDIQVIKQLSDPLAKEHLPGLQIEKQLLPNLQSDAQTAKYLSNSQSKKQLPDSQVIKQLSDPLAKEHLSGLQVEKQLLPDLQNDCLPLPKTEVNLSDLQRLEQLPLLRSTDSFIQRKNNSPYQLETKQLSDSNSTNNFLNIKKTEHQSRIQASDNKSVGPTQTITDLQTGNQSDLERRQLPNIQKENTAVEKKEQQSSITKYSSSDPATKQLDIHQVYKKSIEIEETEDILEMKLKECLPELQENKLGNKTLSNPEAFSYLPKPIDNAIEMEGPIRQVHTGRVESVICCENNKKQLYNSSSQSLEKVTNSTLSLTSVVKPVQKDNSNSESTVMSILPPLIPQENSNSKTLHPPIRQENSNSETLHPPIQQENSNSETLHPPIRQENSNSKTLHPPIRQENSNSEILHPPIRQENSNSETLHPPIRQENSNSETLHPPILQASSSSNDETLCMKDNMFDDMDLTDSQICTSEMSLNDQCFDKGYSLQPPETKYIENDGTKMVKDLIKELVQLNKFIIRSQREMENSYRQKRNVQSTSQSIKKQGMIQSFLGKF